MNNSSSRNSRPAALGGESTPSSARPVARSTRSTGAIGKKPLAPKVTPPTPIRRAPARPAPTRTPASRPPQSPSRGTRPPAHKSGSYASRGAKRFHAPDRHSDGRLPHPNPFVPQVQKGVITNEPHIRVVPLGGLEEIGRNMSYFEYVDPASPHNGKILIVDMGMQFPDENMPGVDYVVPNVDSIKAKRHNVVGVVITHAHMDHIGAIPHIMPMLGEDIPIYSTDLTIAIIKKRQDDYHDGRKQLNLKEINNDTKLQLGPFALSFFGVSHNVPAAMAVIISTPIGIIVHTGDFKLDLDSDIAGHTEIEKIKELGTKNVLLLMSDSTDARSPGHQSSEVSIVAEIEGIIKNTSGRIFFATFSSLLGRINEIIALAERHKKKVVIDGRSMRANVAIATELGYMKYDPNIIVPIEEAHKYDPNSLLILVTGAQGENNAVLMRIVNKRHKYLKIQPGDTVVFSSSVVPGNERSVQALTDKLYRDGAEVLNYKMMDLHAGGHAKQEDLMMLMDLVKPRYIMPIHGMHAFLRVHAKLARQVGIPDANILVSDNGQVSVATKDKVVLTDERVAANYVMVDGLGVGDVQEIVLRDRQAMASDGIFVIIAVVDAQTGKLKGNPDIISRGFVYLRESQDLMSETRRRIKKTVEDVSIEMHPVNFQYVKDQLREKIGQFLFTKTERRPMILPVVIEV